MVYECDQCGKALPPGVKACPNCGEKFDDEVPIDAEIPKRGFTPITPAPAPPPNMPSLPYIPHSAPQMNVRSTKTSAIWSIILTSIIITLLVGILIGRRNTPEPVAVTPTIPINSPPPNPPTMPASIVMNATPTAYPGGQTSYTGTGLADLDRQVQEYNDHLTRARETNKDANDALHSGDTSMLMTYEQDCYDTMKKAIEEYAHIQANPLYSQNYELGAPCLPADELPNNIPPSSDLHFIEKR